MDKETLSNYGWIVICTLVLAVMIALATPFGEYISAGVWSTTNGLNDTLNKNMEIAGLNNNVADSNNIYTFTPHESVVLLDKSFDVLEWHAYTWEILYDDGTFEEKQMIACKNSDGSIGFYTENLNYISSEDDYNSLFDFSNNATVVYDDYGEKNFIYADGKSFYELENYEYDYRQIVSITIDFDKSIDYSNEIGTISENGTFLSWEELKSEYDITDTSIADSAFAYEYGFFKIVIPEGITIIGDRAFRFSDLKYVNFPSTLTTIGDYAFYSTDIKNIYIPEGVTTIGSSAFENCTSLTNITFNGTVAQWNAIVIADSWNYNVPATQVTCSDGVVTL